MPVSAEMSEGLRQSAKGRLNYDRDFFKGKELNDVLSHVCEDLKYTSIRDVTAATPARSAIRFQKSPPAMTGLFDRSPTSSFQNNGCSPVREVQPHTSLGSPTQVLSSTLGSNLSNDRKSATVSSALLEESIPTLDKTELYLQKYEDERIQNVHRVFDRKREEFARHERQSFEKSLRNLETIQGRRKMEEMLRSRDLAAKHTESKNESEKRHQKLRDEHASLAKLMDERLKEATLKDKLEQEAVDKRNNEFKQRINSFIESKQNIFATYQEIASLVKSCANVSFLDQGVFQAVQSVNEMTNAIHKIVEGIRGGKIEQADVDLASSLQGRATSCLEVIKAGVELVNKKIEEASADSAGLVAPLPPSYNPIPREISPQEDRQLNVPTGPAVSQEKIRKGLSPVPNVNGSAKRYFAYMELLEKTKDSYQDLATNSSLKKYKGELQKAVTTPVNAISSQSGSQLMDKLLALGKLITGGQVEVGSRRVSAAEHPQGQAFCLDNLAKRLVRQGEEQISSNHEAAFPIASVIVGLWKTNQDFGELLLAHFFYKCSYLVPFSLARGEGQSEEEYYVALGYEVSNGVLEEKDMFLKRLSGMVRLYAAILQSALPRGISLPHPYGVENGWMLLTQILNLEPLPDITATVLFNFLEVCGHALQANYGKQFHKILILLCKDYFPRIRSITPSDSGGPIGRLENFLQKCLDEGQIPPPTGVLPLRFWST